MKQDNRSRTAPRFWCGLLLTTSALVGCEVHTHRIGGGATGAGAESTRQFYVLFGWLPLNDVDVQGTTGDLVSYEIRTETSAIDLLLTPLLLPLTVTSRTVTVYK